MRADDSRIDHLQGSVRPPSSSVSANYDVATKQLKTPRRGATDPLAIGFAGRQPWLATLM
jgi:hypothetical protein